MPFTRRRILHLAAAAGLPLAGCLGGAGGGGNGGGNVVQTTAVSMVNTQFDPRNIRVSAGATVTWTNEDSFAHTVTNASDNWSFDEELDGGDSTEFTFEDNGVYDVYCRFHGSAALSGMSMKVAVGDASIESPLGGGGNEEGGGIY